METTGILYFYDALCGWCYGFSPVITALYQKYGEKWKFQVVSGGMMMGSRMGAIGQVAPYIREGAYKTVEERTGVKFGEAFIKNILEPGTAILSSLEPAIVMSVFKSFETGKEVLFAAALQKAIYYDGVESNNLEAYVPYVNDFGISLQEFKIRLNDPSYHDRAFDEFKTASKFGIQGFPTTVLLHESDYYVLSRGYTGLPDLEERIHRILSKEK